jgi:hypothetical protein
MEGHERPGARNRSRGVESEYLEEEKLKRGASLLDA